MSMDKTKKNGAQKPRGGKRAGAGRPKQDGRLYSFRASADMARCIDSQPSKTEFIRQSIAAQMTRLAHAAATAMPGEVWIAADVRSMHLPCFDVKVVAGFPVPLDADEKARDIDLLRLLCPHPESSYLIRVTGDSMIDAGIHSGDIVIVDKSRRTPTGSEVAMCELNGEYTLKRVARRDGAAWLVPANPGYPEIRINEGDDFSVWGTVTYVIHRPMGTDGE